METIKEDTPKNQIEFQKVDRKITKAQLCYSYRQCFCQLSKESCDFAHGISDLNMDLVKPMLQEAYEMHKTVNGKKTIDQCIQYIENRIGKQGFSNQNLNERFFLFQKQMKQTGFIDHEYTLEEINKDEKAGKDLKQKLVRQISKDFMDKLYEYFNTKSLNRYLVDLCFRQIGWRAHYIYFADGIYSFEAREKNNKCYSIVKLPSKNEFESNVQTNLINLINKYSLLEQVPISSSKISTYYYKDICNLSWDEPSLSLFLRYMSKTLDAYLQSLEEDANFLKNLKELTRSNLQFLGKVPLFDDSSNENLSYIKLFIRHLQDFEKNTQYSITRLDLFESSVFEELFQKFPQTKGRISIMSSLLKDTCLKNNALIVNLLTGSFIIFGNSLRLQNPKEETARIDNLEFQLNSSNQIEMDQEEQKETDNNKKAYDLNNVKITKHPSQINIIDTYLYRVSSLPAYEECNTVSSLPNFSSQDLEKFLSRDKVIIIDNEAALESFDTQIGFQKVVGVDIEGNLRKKGYIELIQISVGELIFIFDFYSVQSRAVHNNNPLFKSLYFKMAKTIQKVMHDELICKVFHDGRRDSLVLKLFLDSLPVHNYDVSAAYRLNQQLKIYAQHKSSFKSAPKEDKEFTLNNLGTKQCSKIYNMIENVRDPGLNQVLEEYNASHSINPLKKIMKERMHSQSKDYFLKRPIADEYLIYAGKDVQDLVEVKENSLKTLTTLLEELLGPMDRTKIYNMFRVISDWYESGEGT